MGAPTSCLAQDRESAEFLRIMRVSDNGTLKQGGAMSRSGKGVGTILVRFHVTSGSTQKLLTSFSVWRQAAIAKISIARLVER